MIIEVRIDKMKGQVVTGGVILRFIRENNKKSHEQCVNCFDELSTPLLRNLRSMTGSVTVTTATPDTPRYTFQQFMDDRAALQTEYYARAIGPAKQKVWEDKVASLKEWELVVIALDGYQKKEHELFQKLAAATEKASELQKLVEQQTTRSARLENEMEHLEKRLTQEHKDNLQKIRDDTNHQLQVEMAKLEDLHRKEIQERELEDTKMEVIQLRKDLAQVEQQQIQNEEIVQLRAELKSKNQEIEDITRERKAESVQQEQVVKELREAVQAERPITVDPKSFSDGDYIKMTRAWFRSHKKNPSAIAIKQECEKLKMPNKLGWFRRNSLQNWMIHFGKQAVIHALVKTNVSYNV